MEKFRTNLSIHSISTRYRKHHVPVTDLSKYLIGIHCSGIKLLSKLPSNNRSLNRDIKLFKPALKEFLLSHSYSVEEFTLTENS
jgi:hypothetical protein